MDETSLDDFTNDELAEELVSRCGGLASIDIDDLIEELKNRKGVDHTTQESSYKDYCVAIASGEIITGTGKVTILIVEG